MNNKFERRKRFTVTTGPNNTVKLFDAETGSLYRTFPAGGQLINQPIVTENQVVCEVKVNNQPMMNYFSLPGCSLLKSIQISK
jgi:hypothetical protein